MSQSSAEGEPAEGEPSIRRWARRTTYVGIWTGRFVLGSLLLLYALSFVAPPPVERAPLEYDEPPVNVAADAVHNLRTEVYHLSVVRREHRPEETVTVGITNLTVDNRARQYLAVERDRAVQYPARQRTRYYGTRSVGYQRSVGWFSWGRKGYARFSDQVNPFRYIWTIEQANATVLRDNETWYVVRVDAQSVNRSIVRVDQPHDTETRRAMLTLGIRKSTDRLVWARYRATDTDRRFTANYRFRRGLLVDVDRPIGTYPPGDEVFARLDLGIQTVETVLGGSS